MPSAVLKMPVPAFGDRDLPVFARCSWVTIRLHLVAPHIYRAVSKVEASFVSRNRKVPSHRTLAALRAICLRSLGESARRVRSPL